MIATNERSRTSSKSLDAMANLIVTAIDAGPDAHVEYWLHEWGASGAIRKMLHDRYITSWGAGLEIADDTSARRDHALIEGIGDGFEFGLRIAAIIQNHALDFDAASKEIAADIRDSLRAWEKLHEFKRKRKKAK
jgi:hypothetical protein